jgi:hypothetical protein
MRPAEALERRFGWSSSGTRGPKRIEWRSGSATHLAATGAAPAPWVRTRESSPQLLPATPEQRTSIAKVVGIPWRIAVGADLAFSDVPGKRTGKIRMVNAYLPRLHAAAATDASLAAAFIRVLGMVDRPEGLLRPDRALRVLWAHLRGAAPTPATGPVSVGQPREPVARSQVGSTGHRRGA